MCRGEQMSRIERRNQKRSHLIGRLKIIAFSCLLIIFLGFIGYAAIVFGGRFVVDDDKFLLDATTTIETEEGQIIGRLYNENRKLTTLGDIPEHVRQAFIAIEDRRFYGHAGVDFRSVFRAVYKDILAMAKVEGASTITQQLAKNLFLTNDKTWLRKTKEVMAAVYLEQTLSKDKILELYLNEIYFGHGVYGIATAAEYYFSKNIKDLTVDEGAMLAGMAKAPNGYSPINHPEKAKSRRNTVLHAMEATGVLTSKQLATEEEKPLGLEVNKWNPSPWTASYVDYVMKEAASKHDMSLEELKRGGYRIIVNMDNHVQEKAYEQFKNADYFPGNTEGVEGAFMMMDHGTGKVVSVIGGRDFQLGDLNRATVARQPGSTMKPLAVYGPAMMENEKYQPYTLIPDQKIDYDGYTAENYDNEYTGAVSIYEAIVHSKNAPAVWLLNEIGISTGKAYLDNMNLSVEDDGLAIALGGLSKGVTPAKLMESYSSFATNGNMVESHSIERIVQNGQTLFKANPEMKEVFTPQVAWNMTEMLEETVASGTASSGNYSKALAGKTGSTQHPQVEGQSKDAWFAGYTPQYVMTLWMGYDTSDKAHFLTGGSEYPTRLVKSILTEVDKEQALTETFAKPEAVSALPKPIQLPEIKNVQVSYQFGSLPFGKGKLTWQGSNDERVIYRIYREKEGIDERIGEVEGKREFVIDNALFHSKSYYIVPYNPLTKTEGKRSESVKLSW